jgi:hypothetical protein
MFDGIVVNIGIFPNPRSALVHLALPINPPPPIIVTENRYFALSKLPYSLITSYAPPSRVCSFFVPQGFQLTLVLLQHGQHLFRLGFESSAARVFVATAVGASAFNLSRRFC